MDWNAPLTALPKIGEKTAKLFKKLDIAIEDKYFRFFVVKNGKSINI